MIGSVHQKQHPFRVIVIFVVLMIIGFSVVPLITLKLNPSRPGRSLSVSYSWPGASADIIEQQATSKLEGVLATVKGLTDITSRSGQGQGSINLTFDKDSDMESTRFEVGALIRRNYQKLPAQMSYPSVYMRQADGKSKTIKTYTLNGNLSSYELQKYAEDHIKNLLAQIKGVDGVAVYGATPHEWDITYDQEQLQKHGLRFEDISIAIASYFQGQEIGVATVHQTDVDMPFQSPVYYSCNSGGNINWSKIPVKIINTRLIYLTDVCTMRYKEQLPSSYFRINGLNTVNIVISASPDANEIVVGENVDLQMLKIEDELPSNMSIIKNYDATTFLKNELDNVLFRSLLSFIILMAFILLISRSGAYLGLVFLSIISNLFIAFILYYFLKVEIQLYSLAGITISLGIIIDNSIVMIDHIRHQKNKNIFLPVLAATLTTIGAVSVVCFLDENQKLKLIDFTYVLMINLGASLFVSFYFIPALMDKIKIKTRVNKRTRRGKRLVLKVTGVYEKIILLVLRFRVVCVLVMILLFGLPTFLLPDQIKKEGMEKEAEEGGYADWYNSTLGNPWYKENIKEHVDTWLGGTLKLFHDNIFSKAYYGEPERTSVHIRGKMPNGTTIQQMNEVFVEMENFLSQFNEIEQFQTNINGPQDASISILFKPEFDLTAFPYFLKNRIQTKAIYLGGLDWQVYGVGQGFNNSLNSGSKNSRIHLYGYNYETLMEYASELKTKLLLQKRINEVDINAEVRWDSRPLFEYVFDFDQKMLAQNKQNLAQVYGFMSQISIADQSLLSTFINGEYSQIKLKPEQSKTLDVWNIKNYPLKIDSSTLKLKNVAQIKRQKSGEQIVRENQQYKVVVEYDYLGSYQLQSLMLKRFVNETNEILPVGYLAKKQSWSGYSRDDNQQYLLILLVVAIVFIISAVLLESFIKPLVVIFLIPVSFIGVFLTFYIFDFNFDQGGYASFLLLSGLVVNAAFYIIHDYNQFIKKPNGTSRLKCYLKAFNYKIMPILLTVISTMVSMIPFVISGQHEVFWFALAVGSIGGLMFSLVALMFILPIVIKRE